MREANGLILQRPTLAAQASAWLESRRAAIEASTNYPVIVVASAGGGIRAAYWTAGILGSLADKPDHFLDHLFGISSVSGGSVGAAMFAALVKFKDLHPGMHTRALLGGDFLAPVMATMLIRDPVSVALRLPLPDRGAVLEEALERAWQSEMHNRTLAEPMQNLWIDDAQYAVPNLFLNTTRPRYGQRVVISNLSLKGISDLDDRLQTSIESFPFRLSTAAIASARFPYVSPSGLVGTSGVSLVDGGFFDNSGTATALNVLDAVETAAGKAGLGEKVRPVALILANEPKSPSTCPPKPDTGGILEPASTIGTIWKDQTVRFRKELETKLTEWKRVVLSLQPDEGTGEWPLGWTLSPKTQGEIETAVANKIPKAGLMNQIDELLKQRAAVKQN